MGKGYPITNAFGELQECIFFDVNIWDYDSLKEMITKSSEITEKAKNELFKDWDYVTKTKLERNGGYFFKQ